MSSHEFYIVTGYLSRIFQVQPQWFVWPNILTIFIWPMIMNFMMFYYIFQRLMGFFPGPARFIIAGILAFLALPFNQFTSLFAPTFIGLAMNSSIPVRILIIILFYAITFLVMPWLTGLKF